MFDFEKLDGPRGIPVFYQKLPDFIGHSSIALVVFTGSGDDESAGMQGVYHWFEHVPFRGTKKFPNGYTDTSQTISKLGGDLNANTSSVRTKYFATLPTRHLQVGIDVVVDLVAQPLLSEEGINSERRVIEEEIRRALGSANGVLRYNMPYILWPNHPLGHHTLGSIESINSMTPETLGIARNKGYDVSRMAFFISTTLTAGEVLKMIKPAFETLPSNGLSERRRAPEFGPFPVWASGYYSTIGTDFPATIIKILFPTSGARTIEDYLKSNVLREIFTSGGLGSPLYRAIREDQQLAYTGGIASNQHPNGGYWGFHVETSRDKIGKVEKAVRSVLNDPQLRSIDWFRSVQRSYADSVDMRVYAPESCVSEAVSDVCDVGKPYTQKLVSEMLNQLEHKTVLGWLDEISFDEAHTIVACGNG